MTIDGKSAAAVISDREQGISSATPQWKRYLALSRILTEKEATAIELEAKSRTGKLKTVIARRSLFFASESGFALPLFWQWQNEKLVVTDVATAATEKLQPNDIIVSIDGQPAKDAIAETIESLSQRFSHWFPCQAESDQIID